MIIVISIRHVFLIQFLVNSLIVGSVGVNAEQKREIFLVPVIQTLINKTWFQGKKDDGVIHPEFFEDNMLSLSTIALVLTVVSPYILFPLNGP